MSHQYTEVALSYALAHRDSPSSCIHRSHMSKQSPQGTEGVGYHIYEWKAH
jgi:hypothetical protein